MILPPTFDDPVLGQATWDDDRGEWRFTLILPDGIEVEGGVIPENPDAPLDSQGIDEVRDRIRWVRDNEPVIRQHIADQMFEGWLSGWYDEEIDAVTSKAQFYETIRLARISVLEDRSASLYYDDGNLFGGHAIALPVAAGGRFVGAPQIWG